MLNKDKLKGFLSGIIFAAVLGVSALGASVLAAPVAKNISVVYDDIKIYMDGTLIQLKDGNGTAIKPFISKGVTYLPVAAIGRALDKEVSWEGNTKSIYIGKRPQPKEVTVSNVDELFAALGTDKNIKLKPGTYNLSDLKQGYVDSKNISWEEVYDGNELVLKGISDLTIEGLGDEPVEIVVEPRYADVLTFLNCNNISIKNVKAGHTIEKGQCTGGVFNFDSSKGIAISDSILYGCGTYGIIANNTENLKLSDSIIEECTNGVMQISKCKNFEFSNSIFRKCESYGLFGFDTSTAVIFDKCEISENTAYNKNTDMIAMSLSSDIKFTDCKFKNNTLFNLNRELLPDIDFTGTTFE